MEFAQEAVTTLHDFGVADPPAPVDRASVLVPMVGREHGTVAAERLFEALETLDPLEVIVPLRAPPDRAAAIGEWLESFSIPVRVLWCSGPRLSNRVPTYASQQETGKGRDMWLGLGVARGDYIVSHDADATTYTPTDTAKLLAPLDMGLEAPPLGRESGGYSFVKAYYARVENNRLYGRLTRLLYEPLVEAIASEHDADILTYLGAFRYGLAGESAMTADLTRSMRVHPRWGFEVGALGAAFAYGGLQGSAQVDLGRYEHDHRSVEGPSGLSSVSGDVADALFHVLEDHGVNPDYDTLAERYRGRAFERIRAYEADAAFNGLCYDPGNERRQVDTYARSVAPPGRDPRLPAWTETDLDPADLFRAATADLEAARDGDRRHQVGNTEP